MGEIEYAVRDGLHIAYTTMGRGPPDVALVSNWVTNIESVLDLDVPLFGDIVANVASYAPNARLEVFETSDHLPYTQEHRDWMLGTWQEFLTGQRPSPALEDRVLATVLFTDVVSSTETAARLGDREWRRKLHDLQSATASEVARFNGKVINTTGDGILAIFDGPARAIRCAIALNDVARRHRVEIRAGVHTGELESHGDDIGGIAVHIANRVMSLADAGEVLTSSTVKDLIVGSGIEFEDRGTPQLKGVPDEWRIYAVKT